MVTNRVSDVFLFIGILLLAQVYGTVNLDLIALAQAHMQTSESINYYHIVILAIATFNIFIGVVGKSAQLFMHVWLADAMEGPNPCECFIACCYYGYRRSCIINKNFMAFLLFSLINHFSSHMRGKYQLYGFMC